MQLRQIDPGSPDAPKAFEALAPGEGLVVAKDQDPRPQLFQIETHAPRRYEWFPLEAGPARFRFEVRRRPQESPRSINEFLERDHRRLDALMDEIRELVRAQSFEKARPMFAEFRCGLDRHIEMEEQILFPVFEESTGMTQGPTRVMRAEHVEIRRRMVDADNALVAADRNAFESAVEMMVAVLGEHNMKEEQILYPMTDRACGDDEKREEVVLKMMAL